MYYEDHGNGFPLVLVPGFSADHSLWSTVTESLSDRYRVITFDNRGGRAVNCYESSILY